MKGGAPKLILLHKPTSAAFHHRLGILVFLSFFTLTLLTFFHSTSHPLTTSPTTRTTISRLPPDVIDTLLHYAAVTNTTSRMSADELSSIAAVLRHRPCNLLVFGLTAETLLWQTLNRGGHTVFLDENEYLISKLESSIPKFEGYDVHYTTKVSEFRHLISAAKSLRRNECRPVQNLLFSDCKLGINDLPNHLYSINWDVIIVDGPSGYTSESPGRTSAIFTAAVMARSRRSGDENGGKTEVFVHEFEREVEKVSSEEFLCGENLVEVKGSLAHFTVPEMDAGRFQFCRDGGDGGGEVEVPQ